MLLLFYQQKATARGGRERGRGWFDIEDVSWSWRKRKRRRRRRRGNQD